MARKTNTSARGSYRPIHTVLTREPEWRALSAPAQLAFFCIKLELPFTGIGEFDAHTLTKRSALLMPGAEAALDELEGAHWIEREGDYIWLVNGLRYEPNITASNPNHVQAVDDRLRELPRMSLVDRFRRYYGPWMAGEDSVDPKAIGRGAGTGPSIRPMPPSASADGMEDAIPHPIPHPLPHATGNQMANHGDDNEHGDEQGYDDPAAPHPEANARRESPDANSVSPTRGPMVREAPELAMPDDERRGSSRQRKTPAGNKRGKTPDSYAPEFDEFWAARPRRLGGDPKRAAYAVWDRLIARNDATAAQLQEAVEAHAAEQARAGNVGERAKYVPMLVTWLNEDRWRDALDARDDPPPPSPISSAAAMTWGHVI